MLEPLGGSLALGPLTCALGPAYLVHRLIQMAGDMEAIQHVQSLTGVGRDQLQVGLPHVAAHKTQPFDHLRPQCLQAPPQGSLRAPASHPQQVGEMKAKNGGPKASFSAVCGGTRPIASSHRRAPRTARPRCKWVKSRQKTGVKTFVFGDRRALMTNIRQVNIWVETGAFSDSITDADIALRIVAGADAKRSSRPRAARPAATKRIGSRRRHATLARSSRSGASLPAKKADVCGHAHPARGQRGSGLKSHMLPRRAVGHQRACASLVASCAASVPMWDVGRAHAAENGCRSSHRRSSSPPHVALRPRVAARSPMSGGCCATNSIIHARARPRSRRSARAAVVERWRALRFARLAIERTTAFFTPACASLTLRSQLHCSLRITRSRLHFPAANANGQRTP